MWFISHFHLKLQKTFLEESQRRYSAVSCVPASFDSAVLTGSNAYLSQREAGEYCCSYCVSEIRVSAEPKTAFCWKQISRYCIEHTRAICCCWMLLILELKNSLGISIRKATLSLIITKGINLRDQYPLIIIPCIILFHDSRPPLWMTFKKSLILHAIMAHDSWVIQNFSRTL